jgi:hypothetical protein
MVTICTISIFSDRLTFLRQRPLFLMPDTVGSIKSVGFRANGLYFLPVPRFLSFSMSSWRYIGSRPCSCPCYWRWSPARARISFLWIVTRSPMTFFYFSLRTFEARSQCSSYSQKSFGQKSNYQLLCLLLGSSRGLFSSSSKSACISWPFSSWFSISSKEMTHDHLGCIFFLPLFLETVSDGAA